MHMNVQIHLSFGENGTIFSIVSWEDAWVRLIKFELVFWLQSMNFVADEEMLTGENGSELDHELVSSLNQELDSILKLWNVSQNPFIYSIKCIWCKPKI